MIHDTGSWPPTHEVGRYDVCIAGGGVAGIVLAHSLARCGKRILLLEGGGLEFSAESQDLYQGDIVGHDYPELDECRLRFLGGTSNHWAGWCRTLDVDDFRVRDHIPDSGWPIEASDLQPYLPEALDILEIEPFPPDTILAGSNGRLREVIKQQSPPVRFGHKFRSWLAESDLVDLILNANLVDVDLTPDSRRVSAFIVAGAKAAHHRYRAVGGQYVLALGGIENARALLNADRQVKGGIGNESGLVGRFFMDHPHFNIGYFVLGRTPAGFGDARRFLAPTARLTQDAGTAAAHYDFQPIAQRAPDGMWQQAKNAVKEFVCTSDVVADFLQAAPAVDCHTVAGVGRLRVGSEQVPNSQSRVSLSRQRDRFGLRKVELDWRTMAIDKRTIRVGALAVAEYFATRDIGRIKLFDWVLDPEDTSLPGWDVARTVAGNHHMGTTRMGVSARDAVVDRNCRVFGIGNLFVAGSSVFRTCGLANATFTIIQLTLRLSDHLATNAVRAP